MEFLVQSLFLAPYCKPLQGRQGMIALAGGLCDSPNDPQGMGLECGLNLLTLMEQGRGNQKAFLRFSNKKVMASLLDASSWITPSGGSELPYCEAAFQRGSPG